MHTEASLSIQLKFIALVLVVRESGRTRGWSPPKWGFSLPHGLHCFYIESNNGVGIGGMGGLKPTTSSSFQTSQPTTLTKKFLHFEICFLPALVTITLLYQHQPLLKPSTTVMYLWLITQTLIREVNNRFFNEPPYGSSRIGKESVVELALCIII